MTHAHSPEVAKRLLERYVTDPEPWELCPVRGCRARKRGIVCERHWTRAPAGLRAPIRARYPAPQELIDQLVAWWNGRSTP